MTAWLFDIDGVLTAPQSKKVSPEIINIIGKISEKEPVAFVTGRSIPWIKKNVFPLLEKYLNDESLSRLFLSAEKGGVWEFFEDGRWKHLVKDGLNPPERFKNECKILVEERYPESLFWDPKETMVSIEMKDGLPIDDFKKAQKRLDAELWKKVKQYKLENEVEMDSGLIATDIQHKTAGKDLAAMGVEAFLKKRGLIPDVFLTFGDSGSDIAMASHLYREGYNVDFIFTGDRKLLGGKKFQFTVDIYDGQYEKGTLSYLQKHFQLA